MQGENVAYNVAISVLMVLHTRSSSVCRCSVGFFFVRASTCCLLVALHQFRAARRGDLRMEEKKKKKKRGGKVSKFGLFSPAVVGAKVALGESRLNKLRGKVS